MADKGQLVEALDQAEIVSRSSEEASFPHYVFGICWLAAAPPGGSAALLKYLSGAKPTGRRWERDCFWRVSGMVQSLNAHHPISWIDFTAARAAKWASEWLGRAGYRGAGLVSSMLSPLDRRNRRFGHYRCRLRDWSRRKRTANKPGVSSEWTRLNPCSRSQERGFTISCIRRTWSQS